MIYSLMSPKDLAQASYIGEDGRFTLLRGKFCESATLNPADPREIHTMFRTMAANSSGSSASIPQATLRLLPIISQTLIRQYYVQLVIPGSPPILEFVGELQANNNQLHMSYARLQATQKTRQAREQQTEGRLTIYCTCVP
jgi:hypothetical protein